MNETVNFNERGPPNHFEGQVELLCGKHAINHLLQEEKVVYIIPEEKGAQPARYFYKDPRTGKTEGPAPDDSSPLNPYIQINLPLVCDKHDEHLAGFLGMTMEEVKAVKDSRCNDKYQNLPFQAIQFFLQDNLRYKLHENNERDEILVSIPEALGQSDLIGILLNLNSIHYTCITKFLRGENLWKLDRNTFKLQKVAYIDSQDKEINAETGDETAYPRIFSIPNLMKFLSKLNFRAALFVYAQPGCYRSVAVDRLNELKAFGLPIRGGGKRKTRRAHKKSRKTRRNHRK